MIKVCIAHPKFVKKNHVDKWGIKMKRVINVILKLFGTQKCQQWFSLVGRIFIMSLKVNNSI